MQKSNYYTGNIETFVRVIEPYTRQIVLKLSRKKKKHTTCKSPGCNKRIGLQAAHLVGFENKKIIAQVIRKLCTEEETITIDINDFCTLYEKAHTPLEKVVQIICRDCHTEYERDQKKKNVDFTDLISFEEEHDNTEEVIQELKSLKDNEIDFKSELINLLNKKRNFGLSKENVTFAKLNNTVPVYWLEPRKKKFKNSQNYFLLFETESKKYFLFEIGLNKYENKFKNFKEKNRDRFKFEIQREDDKFIDRFSNVNFDILYKGKL